MKRKNGKKNQTNKAVDQQAGGKKSGLNPELTRRGFFQAGGKVGVGSAMAFAFGGLSGCPEVPNPDGYCGQVLWVDLSRGRIRIERPDAALYRQFLGGYGLGARLIYDELKKQGAGFDFDALDESNILGFATGLLTGTPAYVGARFTVMAAKSPLTGSWADANAGGHWGPVLKFAGFDAVFFTGASAEPVYLYIEDGQAELRAAGHLWGQDTFDTEDARKSELGE